MSINETYDLPEDYDFIYEDGKISYIKNPGSRNEKIYPVTGSKVKIINISRESKSGKRLSYTIQFVDFEGKIRTLSIQASRLIEDIKGITAELADLGFDVYNQPLFILLLTTLKDDLSIPKREVISSQGWHDEKLAFTLPYTTLKKSNNTTDYYYLKHDDFSIISPSDSLENYSTQVIQLIKQDRLFIFAAMAALATILQGLSDVESGGIHLYGDSSSGKTTALQVFASIFGSGADPSISPKKSSIGRFNATANGIEAKCVEHSKIGLAIDELGSLLVKNFGALIYDMAGGQGKAVMNRKRDPVEPKTWELIFLSTGEQSIEDKLITNGEKLKAGMSVRIADTPMAEIDRYNGCDVSEEESRKLVESLKVMCSKYHGTLGPAFIQYIIDKYTDLDDAKDAVAKLIAQEKSFLAASIPSKSNVAMRGVTRFALILAAGKLLVQSQLVDLTNDEVESAVQAVLDAWIKGTNSISIEERGLESVRQYINNNMHKIVDISSMTSELHSYPSNLAGYRDGNINYFLTEENMAKAIGDVDLFIVKRALRNNNHLHLHKAKESDRRYKTRKTIPGLGSLSLYIIKGSFVHNTTK